MSIENFYFFNIKGLKRILYGINKNGDRKFGEIMKVFNSYGKTVYTLTILVYTLVLC
jgi:hypothetical protein